jgi:superfamily II DNA or RNA helicase
VSSLHPSAPEIIKSGIFNNVKNFDELKKRISKTKSFNNRGVQLTKGDIFEIFCEAYLTVNKEYQIKKIYPQAATPVAIRKNLGLPPIDDGWDGVYETLDGKFATWQAKFRTKNEMLLWQGDNGLSSTVAKGQRADIIHLITTVTKIPSSFTNSDKIMETLGNRLEPIEPAYFRKIEKWLNKKKFEKEALHKPDGYQIDALNNIKEEFKNNNRATVIMACGSGKTDIGVWEYLRQKPKLALVLVPSIALVKQIRADWLSQITHKVVTFQLCSSKDTSKKEDCLVVKEKELDMKISTDPKELKLWTKRNLNKSKIIFSTYQSSEVMNIALKGKVVDFAVFDEAHRTAIVNKKLDSYYSNALFDKNIRIKKRLFMTATRKITRSNNFNKHGDIKLNVNMDNTEIYGNVCYKLSFTKAAKKFKCIASLKIIVSEIFSDEIDFERAKISSTHVDGEKLKSEYLANIIAIKRAIEKYKIKKGFSFHSMIGAARDFTTSEGPVNIGYHLDNFYTNFIEGKMGMKKRDEIMKEFDGSSKSLIANKRCLIEGVDVPAVNMVVFNNPKESVVDIVQAVGRALRNRKDIKKKYGYVLVPIFIDRKRNESHEDAIERSNFEKVTEVINAVKQHDDEIAQVIQEASISYSRGKGITKKIKDSLDDFVEVYHPEISKSVLFKSITAKIVDKFQTAWEVRIGELLNFKEKFGHLKIPSSPEYKNLGKWCQHIRNRWFENKLLDFQIKKLNEIGFLKFPEAVTIFEKGDLLTLPELSKKTGAPLNILNIMKEHGSITSAGKIYGPSKEQAIDAYKPYTAKDLKKILNVDYFTKGKYETANTLSLKLKISTSIIEKYILASKIKSIGTAFYGQVGNSINLYKPIKLSKKKVFKKLGLIKKNKNLLFVDELAAHLKKITGSKTNLKWHVEGLIEDDKIKPKGFVVGSGGDRAVFEKINLKQFIEITGVTIFNKEGMHTANSLSTLTGVSSSKISQLIKKGILKSVGLGISPAGVTSYYKITIEEFKQLLGVDFFDTSKLFTLSGLARKFKIESSALEKLLILADVKPIGRGLSSSDEGTSDYYEEITLDDIKDKTGILFITKKDKEGLFTIKKINQLIKKAIGVTKRNEKVVELLEKNNIFPAGKGTGNTANPINYYKPISKKIIKQIFKKNK